jgi:DNA ligase (NAD+)
MRKIPEAIVSESYHEGEAIMDDATYDKLYTEEKVGYEVASIEKSKHLCRLYSLKKVFDKESDPLGGMETVITPKLDGAAISLLYQKHKLVKAITRGDGIQGLDITKQIKYMFSVIPQEIEYGKTLFLVGEVVAPNTASDNPRNFVSGVLHTKEFNQDFIDKIKLCAFFAYDAVYIEERHLFEELNYRDLINSLYYMGFDTVLHIGDAVSLFPTDGEVERVSLNQTYSAMGYTATHPRGAVAHKKSSDVSIEETLLLDVTWQVGKGGKITPVGIMEPVNIDGATVSRASLHNSKIIKELDLGINDVVYVTRSGGIIPKIVGKAECNDLEPIILPIYIPSICPECNSTLKEINDQLFCVNDQCPAIISKRITQFAKILGIKGLGPVAVEKMGYEAFSDIFEFDEDTYIDSLGEKIGAKVFKEVQNSKENVTLDKLIQAFSIPNIGMSSSQKLAETANNLSDISPKKAGLGEVASSKVEEWLIDNADVISYFSKWEIKHSPKKREEKELVEVCVTGKVSGYSRQEMREVLLSYGYKLTDSVTKKTAYLVSEENIKSAKLLKAIELKIPIINFKDLLQKKVV